MWLRAKGINRPNQLLKIKILQETFSYLYLLIQIHVLNVLSVESSVSKNIRTMKGSKICFVDFYWIYLLVFNKRYS